MFIHTALIVCDAQEDLLYLYKLKNKSGAACVVQSQQTCYHVCEAVVRQSGGLSKKHQHAKMFTITMLTR